MKHGRYHKRSAAGRKNSSKKLALLLSLILLMGAIIGGTLAYLVTSTGPVANTFEAGHVGCTVTANGHEFTVAPDSKTNTTVYLRAAVVANWVKDGAVYWQNPAVSVTHDDNWKPNQDGFYYYQPEVSPNGSATKLTITTNDTAPSGYQLQIQVLGEAIQSKPGNVTWDNSGMN